PAWRGRGVPGGRRGLRRGHGLTPAGPGRERGVLPPRGAGRPRRRRRPGRGGRRPGRPRAPGSLVTTVGFVIHGGRPAAVEAARDLVRWLTSRNVVARSLNEDRLGTDEVSDLEGFPRDLALVVSVGGDGTFLRAAYKALRADCPVLGVNGGRMGFLTEVDPPD